MTSGNVNCTKLPIPALWDDQSNRRCVQEYIQGCQSAKIEQFCHQGAVDHLNRNTNCDPPKKDFEYGMDFYLLCCNVCAKGKQAYLNRQNCKRDLPPNADLSQVIVQAEFENCCSSRATKGLRSTSDYDEDYFADEISVCTRFGCDHFCEELDYDKAACTCRSGFQLNRDGRKCDDIDECLNPALNICGPDERCSNLLGTYQCLKTDSSNGSLNGSLTDSAANVTTRNLAVRSQLNEQDEIQCKKNEYFDPHRNKCIGK